jgi:hypothetical protein
MFGNDVQGAIMAVGASKPTVVADADGFFSVKSKMLVSLFSISFLIYKMMCFTFTSLLIGRPYKDPIRHFGVSVCQLTLYRLYYKCMTSWSI